MGEGKSSLRFCNKIIVIFSVYFTCGMCFGFFNGNGNDS